MKDARVCLPDGVEEGLTEHDTTHDRYQFVTVDDETVELQKSNQNSFKVHLSSDDVIRFDVSLQPEESD